MNATWLNMIYEFVDSIHAHPVIGKCIVEWMFVIEYLLLFYFVDCLLRLWLWIVTPLMLEQDIISVAQYVLVVEKESGITFHKRVKDITES